MGGVKDIGGVTSVKIAPSVCSVRRSYYLASAWKLLRDLG